jgi:branched-chain amino acid transport system ATP-binding protein/sulfate-transporting ATPase
VKPTVLKTTDLTVSFGGLKALNGLNFELFEGQFLGLIGPNGSGKTTFFNALTGIYRPASGNIFLHDKEITGASPNKVYGYGITRTFQRLRLATSLSVLDNLIIGNQRNLNFSIWRNILDRRYFKSQLEEQTEMAASLLHRFSPDLAALLFNPVSSLSMIDRRRVEVCRALISEPKILLLDEPSAGMTPDETRALMDELQDWRAQHPTLSTILIEHEMELINKVSDTCVVLNYGEKIAEGPYSDVSNNPSVRAAYLGDD